MDKPQASLLDYGLHRHKPQIFQQLLQVLWVGLTLGLMRTVIPALATEEFGLPAGSFALLATFVVAFGFVKGTLNFVAGRLSEKMGRKPVLIGGWLVALPIPLLIYWAPNWYWIVAATLLLGVNQGLAWSMTQTSKLDLAHSQQRGLTIGLNEFSGYIGVALGGIITGYLASLLGARLGLLLFGYVIIGFALLSTLAFVRETLPWARQESPPASSDDGLINTRDSSSPNGVSPAALRTRDVFALVSWRDKRFAALCQAGLVEKFVDALVWVFYPVYLYEAGLSLPDVGWVIGVYGFTWGGSQFLTGKLSDHIGRQLPNIAGMWLCAGGVLLMLWESSVLWWSFSAAVTGFGMALLYPNLSAAVADIAHPLWRGSAIGIYRFWRDLGYGIGALGLGITAHVTGSVTGAFWFVALAMFLSGAVLWYWGEETHPTLRPESAKQESES